jgi:hypothetical protein
VHYFRHDRQFARRTHIGTGVRSAGCDRCSTSTHGDLACGNNTPAPAGSGNLVFGTAHGQCSNLGTISFTEEPLAVAASQADRRQAILAVLDDRADLG